MGFSACTCVYYAYFKAHYAYLLKLLFYVFSIYIIFNEMENNYAEVKRGRQLYVVSE